MKLFLLSAGAFSAYSLMSTNALAFLFLTKHRKGATFDHLVHSMNWIREEITKRNKTLNFFGDSAELITRATTLLGKGLVNVDAVKMEWYTNNNVNYTYYRPSINLPEVLELQYYANSVLPVFLLESVVVNAVFSSFSEESEKISMDKNNFVLRKDILKQCLELCSILQYEFIFSPPGTSICTVLNATIDELLDSSLLRLKKKSIIDEDDSVSLHNSVLDDFFICGDQAELSQEITLNSEETKTMVQFLLCILTPLIESYFLAASILPKLIDTETEETILLQEIKSLGHKKIHLGQISHEECLGLDTLKNALKLFESWKILSVRTQNSQKLYSLLPYYSDIFRVEDVINRIRKYKN